MADAKNLHPADRIKKLKEMQKEKEKEIAKAAKDIRDAQEQLKGEQEWADKVPVPQVAAENVEGLSEEEKLLLQVHKGLKKKQEVKEESKEKKVSKKVKEQPVEDMGLEETLAAERESVNLEQMATNSQYLTNLSQVPMQSLYSQISTIYEEAKDKGYLSSENQRNIQYIGSAIEKKLDDVEAGRYSLGGANAQFASLSQELESKLNNMYQGQKSNSSDEKSMNDWYK